MKILILSRTPWREDNSFGSTFSNFFGTKEYEISNIICGYGNSNSCIPKRTFQITEKLLVKNLINSENPSGKEIHIPQIEDQNIRKKTWYDLIKNYKFQVFYWIQEFIWLIGRWKSPKLINFIEQEKPDLIFQPIYYSFYLNRICRYIKKITNAPMVCFVADDAYTLRQFSCSPLFWIDRLFKRKSIKKTISKCEYMYVISEIQKIEYEKCFHKLCIILTKGADFNSEPIFKKTYSKPLKLVYTGNIGDGRWLTLSKIGKALKNINNNDIKAILYIYTATLINKKMKKVLNIKNAISLEGYVPSDKIKEVQEEADILVHVESFRFKNRLAVHQSFSTKIVDYLSRAKCIFAVGPADVASIDYFIKNEAAIIATDKIQIAEQVRKLIKNPKLIQQYSEKAFQCGKNNHQIENVQTSLYEDLKKISNVD